MNPRKWNAICWVLLLLWCLPSIPGNMPFEPDMATPGPIELPNGSRAYSYEQVYMIGWPLGYLEFHKAPSKATTKKYKPINLLLNVLLVAATFAGIVYSVQTFAPKFSLKALFFLITLVALLFATGNLIFATNSYYLQFGFIMAIYFSPLIACIPAFLYAEVRDQKQGK